MTGKNIRNMRADQKWNRTIYALIFFFLSCLSINASASSISCQISLLSNWGNGSQFAVRISNLTSAPLNSWDMEISLPNGSQVFNSWTVTRQGTNPVVFSNQPNQVLQPGASMDHHFGFQVNHNGNAYAFPVITRCGDPVTPQPEPTDDELLLGIDTDRTYGTIDTVFSFSPKQITANIINSSSTFLWKLSDGRTFTTENISASFLTAGIHSVELTINNSNQSLKATIPVLIYGGSERSVGNLELAPIIGDVNGDGSVTLVDAHLIAKFTSGIQALSPNPQQLAADVNFDRKVDIADAKLIADGLLEGQPLPNNLLNNSGNRGAVVTLISPLMLNPADLIEIEVGATERQAVIRPYMGYANFVIPFTIPESTTPQQIPVKLYRNNILVSSYDYTLNPSEALSANPVQEAISYLDDLKAVININEQLLKDQFSAQNLQATDLDVLNAVASASIAKANDALDEMKSLLNGQSGEAVAIKFLEAAKANGLSNSRSEMQSFIQSQSIPGVSARGQNISAFSLSPDAVCDELLPALCALKTSVQVLETSGAVVGAACDLLLAAALGATLYPGDGVLIDAAALFAWVTACGTVEASIDVFAVFSDLISEMDADLKFDVSNANPLPTTPAILKPTLEVFGVDDICQIGAGAGANRIVEKLAEQATARLIRRKFSLRAMQKIFEQLGEDALQSYLQLLEDTSARVITQLNLDTAIQNFAAPYCADIYGAELIISSSRVLTEPNPNEGTLNFLSDGTAEYFCPEDMTASSSYTFSFTAQLDICGENFSIERQVSCSAKTLTIQMGDNGNALDDIYEIRVNGTSVLTSSSPVRTTSISLELPSGSTNTIEMLGRAAPDGIGTYFVYFYGAATISGAPNTGSDLTPGVVKVFTVVMPN